MSSPIGKNPNNASAIIPYYKKKFYYKKDQIIQKYITLVFGDVSEVL